MTIIPFQYTCNPILLVKYASQLVKLGKSGGKVQFSLMPDTGAVLLPQQYHGADGPLIDSSFQPPQFKIVPLLHKGIM